MEKVIAMLKQKFYSDTTRLTPRFSAFYRAFKRGFGRLLRSRYGARKIVFSKGHFHIYGFFTMPDGQLWYFSVSDVRVEQLKYTLFVRAAKDYDNYFEPNFVSLTSVENLVADLDEILLS